MTIAILSSPELASVLWASATVLGALLGASIIAIVATRTRATR